MATIVPFPTELCRPPRVLPISTMAFVRTCLQKGCRTLLEGHTADEAEEVLKLHLLTVHREDFPRGAA